MENNVKSQYNNAIAHIKSIRNMLYIQRKKVHIPLIRHIRRDTDTWFEANYRLKHHTYILKRKYYQPNAAKPADAYHSVERYALSVTVLDTEGI